MATSMKSLTFSVSRCIWRNNGILKHKRIVNNVQQNRSKSTDNDRTHYVALSEDESTVICYHPEPDFPYECTKPLPRKAEELSEGASALKVQHLQADRLRLRKDGPTEKELAQMFHTTKHQWAPMPQLKYRKSKPPKDRDSI